MTAARTARCLALLIQSCGGSAPVIPVLLVEERPTGAVVRLETDPPWAAHFALRSQSGQGLRALNLETEDLQTRLESAGHPLSLDLEEESLERQLRRSLGRHLPRITAARWLAASPWTTADGQLVVRLALDCVSMKRHETCLKLADGRQDSLARRARFAAWPVAGAAWIQVADEPLRHVVELLRIGADDPRSTIAMVLTGTDLRFGRDARERLFHNRLERLESLLRRRSPEHARMVAAWCREPPSGATFQGLSLGEAQVLVVPRMGALARLRDFRREIERILRGQFGDGRARWLRPPPERL